MKVRSATVGLSTLAAACLAVSGIASVQPAQAALIHDWNFASGSLADTVAGGPTAVLENGATITAGTGATLPEVAAFSAPASDSTSAPFVSLGSYVLPTSGSVTLETYINHFGNPIGYYTNVFSFNNDTNTGPGGQPSSNGSYWPSGSAAGQYLQFPASQPARTFPNQSNVGPGSAVAFATAGTASEQDSFSTTPTYLDVTGKYFIDVVIDSSTNTMTYYLNGVAQTPVTLSAGQSLSNFSDVNSVLGISAFGGDPEYAGTSYSFFKIYNTALSASQIMADYTAATATPEPASLGFLAIGAVGLLLLGRKRLGN
jgi:hypothetical protein